MFAYKQKKLIIAAAAVMLLAAGGYGVYRYTHSRPVVAETEHGAHQGGAVVSGDRVSLDARARQLAGVQTAKAEAKALTDEIRATGKMAVAEPGRAYLSSRIMGRIDELYINAAGAVVAPGQALAAVYSPDYIAAQEEYLIALDTAQRMQHISDAIDQTNARLLQAARRKLELLGVAAADIEQLRQARQIREHLIIRAEFGGTIIEKLAVAGNSVMAGDRLFAVADLSTVWLEADVYERDIAGVRVGQEAAVTTPAYPGRRFNGVVSFISPLLDDAARTAKVRIELANDDGSLKPNMFASVAIKSPLAAAVAIPASSLIDTGLRQFVFVAADEATFVKRDIVAGREAGGFIQILSGLDAGETVVTRAAFLIDSQTQLGAYGSHAGHGGSAGANTSPQAAPAPSPRSAPDANGHSGH
ncbi:MAG: efflux RND transporter periplasmic adaptor subunit [Sporomusaceae bacterium]|nr:efflux RND transporter periplasmic adaptor subunit [Sporomusaceae bacterium]